jgi:hypothetical protein
LKRRRWGWHGLLAVALFALNVTSSAPLFRPGEVVYSGSIEGGYASFARFVASHPNPWGWNPTQYCGLPTQFSYLPALPYLSAAAMQVWPQAEPGHVYRAVATAFTCFTPVALFLFVLYFTSSWRWALAAGLAGTFFSPLYGLTITIGNDRGLVQLPWRMQLLAKYGEGPHNAAFAIAPLALLALWSASRGGRYRQIFLAAVLLAAVALTNWIAALALGLCTLLVLVTVAGGNKQGLRVAPILAAAGLAYLLAAFWLTPEFVDTVAFNWPVDAFNYQLRRRQIALLLGLVAGIWALRTVFRRFPGQEYLCFLTLAFFTFTYIVFNFYWYGLQTIPESRRYALEWEWFAVPFFLELLRQARNSASSGLRLWAVGGAVLLVYPGLGQFYKYLTEDYGKLTPVAKEQTIEFQLAKWIADRNPAGRVFASGGVRFRLNSWFDLPQLGGTFESGLQNRIPVHFIYQIRTGIGSPEGLEGQQAISQLKAVGVEYVVVNGPASQEYYRDIQNPWKFEGLLERVFREGDDAIYRIPTHSLAHLVRPEELPPYPPIGGRLEFLDRYVAAIDDSSRPKLKTSWNGTNELLVEGSIPEGMLVSVQVSHNRGWTATQEGRPLRIDRDNLGFLALSPLAAADARIELRYRGTTEQRVMAAISALAWVSALGGLALVRKKSIQPI